MSALLDVDPQPWDRRPGESAKHYAAFRIYRDTPPLTRSVPNTVVEGLAPGSLLKIAKTNEWMERAEAWDDACHHLEDQERLEAIREMHRVHREAGQLAVTKAMQGLRALSPADINAGQIARLLQLGAKLERDTLIVSVEELQGIEVDDEIDDPWEAISRELTPPPEM